MLLRLGSLSIEFNMWNPLNAFAPFILLSISIPLAILAVITTCTAITLLSLRAFTVYVQLGLALLSAWIRAPPSKETSSVNHTRSANTPLRSPAIRHGANRRSSIISLTSQDTITTDPKPATLHSKSGSFTALIGAHEITRDFEGVGGWRLSGNDDEEALWMGINSRLKLPTQTNLRNARHHRRSRTGEAIPVESQRRSWSPEALRMSPLQSRARTPVRFAVEDEQDYFSQPNHEDPSDIAKKHKRQKSSSASSTSSTISGSVVMTGMKEKGE